jgi:hypothetical protein
MMSKVLVAAAAATMLMVSPALAADAPAAGERPEVAYKVLFLKDGAVLSAPTVVAAFGREARIEVSDLMRVEVSAQTPDENGRSFTTARMFVFKDGAWQAPKEMSMLASLTATPSFEYSVEGTPYRFVVMPRQIAPAASEGQP